MDFLGYSQTFVGVLTSLVVLCILDSGNFIHGILEKIGDRINNEIDQLEKTATKYFEQKDIKGAAAYKLLQRFIRNNGDGKLDLLKEALKLDMAIKVSIDRFQSDYSPKFIKPASTLVGEIKDSKEQLIAPLYVLLYCIIVFICDGIIHNAYSINNIIVTFLTIFTSFSYGFWGILWYAFLRGVKIGQKGDESNNLKENNKFWFEEWICNHTPWGVTIIFIVIWCVILLTISSMFDFSLWIKRLLIFGLGILLPVVVIAICRIRSHKQFGQYLYVFSFKHFLGLFFLSFLLTALFGIVPCLYDIETSQLYYLYSDFILIKIFIISFIIINGLFLPFFIPLKGYNRILKLAQKEVKNAQANLNRDMKETIQLLEDFCKKIE